MKNEAFYLTEVGKLEKQEIPMPACGADEVVVKNEYMGICGSDLFFFGDHNHEIADGQFELPLLLGHECAGEVIEVGVNVRHLEVGDRVALTFAGYEDEDPAPGAVAAISGLADSGQYTVYIQPETDAPLPLGLSVEVRTVE